jgi:hypothetical protein
MLTDGYTKYFKFKKAELTTPKVFNYYVQEDGIVSISILEKNWHFHRELRNISHPTSLIVAEYDPSNNSIKKIYSKYENNEDLELTKTLTKGYYLVWAYKTTDPNEKIAAEEMVVRFCAIAKGSVNLVGDDTDFELIRNLISTRVKEENKEELQKEDSWKKNWIVCLILTVIVIVLFGNNYNPIKSLENENGASYLMNYTYSAMLPFNKEIKFSDVSCLATMISIFPAGLFIAIYYIFKVENKHLEFFAPTIIISIIEIMILIINKTAFIVPNYILSIGFSVLQIYIVVYIFSNVKEKLFDLKKSTYIAISGVVVLLMMPFPREISDIVKRDIPYMIFVTESVMVLNYTDRRFWKLASWIFTVLTLFESIGFLIVNFV